uniref:Suppressor of glucose, autophagy associated 1 n=1 Tax=Gasterosteus aculeatus aculeatus TaxID=481459 RepID=G3NPZ7_GASAC
IRLHSQLDSVEKKRSRLDQENEELRVRLQDLEVAKQVLQQEIDKVGTDSQRKRGARANNKPDKKLCPQEDSSDLKCQLHFAKEETALMCKKLTKLVKDGDAMKEELAKFRSLYGDVNASLTVEEVADSPHTREAEIRVHLKLVEEEANLLSRRIVELEVENRGLRAEMDDMKGPQGSFLGLGGAMVLGGGASSENVMELQRHLQFVEEEAELLRRSLIEIEEQNKLLMNEINRYKSDLPPPTSALSSNSLTPRPTREEIRLARLQIGELGGKVKKLQYENRVLLSNLQRCDLASLPCSFLLLLLLLTATRSGDRQPCDPEKPHTQARVPRVAVVLFVHNNSELDSLYFLRGRFLTTMADGLFPQVSELSDLADRPLVGALTSRLQALHTQLQAFVEQVDILGKPPAGGRDPRVEGASPLASPCASPPCSGDGQDGKPLSCSRRSVSSTENKIPFQKINASTAVIVLRRPVFASQHQEEHQKALLRRDFQLESLGLQARLQQRLWSQERTLLVQESQHLKQALLLLSLRLRCFLKQWRLGCRKDTQWKDFLEMNSLKDLYLLLEEENLTSPAHQSSAVSSTLADLKVTLQDLSGELRQERQGSQELTQQFAKAKASWEVERTELKSLITQLETKSGKAAALSVSDAPDPPDLKVALKREREEHQHLLADSYAAVMDLTKQLQIGERNWGREKMELLEMFSQERAQWEQRLGEATAQQGKVDHIFCAFLFFVSTLSPQTPQVGYTCKTWDGPSGSCSSSVGSDLHLETVQRSHTAPDRTSIRMYYSPPAVRRTEHRRRSREAREPERAQDGSSSLGVSGSGADIGEISANLSDDMKEMTNCVRQAIRSSSLERKPSKEPGSQAALGVSTRSTQTNWQYVSIGLQTDNLPSSRGMGLHSKAWSTRPSSTTTSSLASARSRQISTSLDKVHSRIDRPCCSPKYGSPKLQRSTSRLDGSPSSRDRSLWSLQQRPLSGGGRSAWARSTTTRDSPVLNGLTDGLSSLFSVVEHAGSTESLWRGDGGKTPLFYGTHFDICLVQEFFRSVCSSRGPGAVTLSEERALRDPGGALGGPGVSGGFAGVDEPKPAECVAVGIGGFGALDAPCDCAAQSPSCLARPSRAAARHSLGQCKHRPPECPAAAEEKADTCNE